MALAKQERDESEIEVDVTVYGATGFVGKHVCRYLLDAADVDGQPLRIALAGRNQAKLEARKDSLEAKESSVDVFVVESSDLAALKKMAERTRVVINCAGPFIKYGSNVVAACATVGADYVDITGEITWAGQMRAAHGSQARKSGARIISLCGFDSIPSDISIFAAVQALRQSVGSEVEIESGRTWYSAFGLMNGGTLHSGLEFPFDPYHCLMLKEVDKSSFRKVPFFLDDPLLLTHPSLVRHNPDYKELKDKMAAAEWKNQLLSQDSIVGRGMSVPFFMAAVNAKVVAASAVALKYGPNFTYSERCFPVGFRWSRTLGVFSAIPALLFQAFLCAVVLLFMLPVIGKKLADLLLPPGTGAPDSVLDSGYAQVYAEVTTKAEDDRVDRVTCFVSFQGDPGNLVTAQCVGEAALSLVHNRSDLPARSEDGFGTPAELLGPVLLKRLQESKVRDVKVVTTVHRNAPIHETQVFM
jgi:short subunit dehydrogenase-like uncharacterized protein